MARAALTRNAEANQGSYKYLVLIEVTLFHSWGEKDL